jgi:hypothetical protein
VNIVSGVFWCDKNLTQAIINKEKKPHVTYKTSIVMASGVARSRGLKISLDLNLLLSAMYFFMLGLFSCRMMAVRKSDLYSSRLRSNEECAPLSAIPKKV